MFVVAGQFVVEPSEDTVEISLHWRLCGRQSNILLINIAAA
jgi:hypothetical protein